jgi:hypothetical protein
MYLEDFREKTSENSEVPIIYCSSIIYATFLMSTVFLRCDPVTLVAFMSTVTN